MKAPGPGSKRSLAAIFVVGWLDHGHLEESALWSGARVVVSRLDLVVVSRLDLADRTVSPTR
jgi:hypothetical protein